MTIRNATATAALFLLSAACTPAPPPAKPATPAMPAAPPPVACTDAPSGRQVTVSCRYFRQDQTHEVWDQVLDRASLAAIALGFTHVQFLSVDLRPETMPYATTLSCRRTFTGQECDGGQTVQIPIATVAVNQLALLSTEEAAQRLADPLIPADRRPIDARRRIEARRAGGGPPGAAPPPPPAR